jgi:pimeloyl-ACP methyl ester carboxylesterase
MQESQPTAWFVTASDGCRLATHRAGDGSPIVFVHEFSGDWRAWDQQVAYFAPKFQCITYCARGYLPSDVPEDITGYGQARAADDLGDVIMAAGAGPAHVVGLSMGGYAALHLALRRPELVRSLLVAGCGYGAEPDQHATHAAAAREQAAHAERIGMAAFAREIAAAAHAEPLRMGLPDAWAGYVARLSEHSLTGMAMTLRGLLATRPSLFALEAELRNLRRPVTLMIGDRDTPCLAPNLFLHRTIPDSALCVLPRTGHLPNLEVPALFNTILQASLQTGMASAHDTTEKD